MEWLLLENTEFFSYFGKQWNVFAFQIAPEYPQ
jgi:hypothetical protein